MEVNIQVFLPGSGILHWSNYRVCTGMMIGPATLLARGKLQYILRYSGITCLVELYAPQGQPNISALGGKNSVDGCLGSGTMGGDRHTVMTHVYSDTVFLDHYLF